MEHVEAEENPRVVGEAATLRSGTLQADARLSEIRTSGRRAERPFAGQS